MWLPVFTDQNLCVPEVAVALQKVGLLRLKRLVSFVKLAEIVHERAERSDRQHMRHLVPLLEER